MLQRQLQCTVAWNMLLEIAVWSCLCNIDASLPHFCGHVNAIVVVTPVFCPVSLFFGHVSGVCNCHDCHGGFIWRWFDATTHYNYIYTKEHMYTLRCHLLKAWQNFWKARYLWCAEKIFWFMAKVLGFAIYKTSASNEDFLKSWWRSKCSNLYFPPLEYVGLFV